MSRLTVTIPASRAAAVNAALAAAVGPEAAGTFHMHPSIDAEGTPDTSLMVASWDLDATGHEAMVAVVAKTIEDNAKTGTGKTAKTADIRIGADPRLAVKVAAADI